MAKNKYNAINPSKGVKQVCMLQQDGTYVFSDGTVITSDQYMDSQFK